MGPPPDQLGRRAVLQLLAQLFQRPLFDAGHIGPGNPEGGGNFPLGQGDGAAQPVPQANDLRLPGGQTLPDDLVEPESSMVSSTPTTSISWRALPSLSVSMESDRETSPWSFFWLRKYMRISFAILS